MHRLRVNSVWLKSTSNDGSQVSSSDNLKESPRGWFLNYFPCTRFKKKIFPSPNLSPDKRPMYPRSKRSSCMGGGGGLESFQTSNLTVDWTRRTVATEQAEAFRKVPKCRFLNYHKPLIGSQLLLNLPHFHEVFKRRNLGGRLFQ